VTHPSMINFPSSLDVRYDGQLSDAPGVRVTKLDDLHAFLQVPEELRGGLGEVWSFGISHPCGAFDRRRRYRWSTTITR
jgi:D-serine deaminase-like pyridoxal phosphate-dependent protein